MKAFFAKAKTTSIVTPSYLWKTHIGLWATFMKSDYNFSLPSSNSELEMIKSLTGKILKQIMSFLSDNY